MSAQVYPPQAYSRQPAQPRRHPLTNAVSHNHNPNIQQQPILTPPKPALKQTEPSSPPLPRQNSKTTPPSPPKVIRDKAGLFIFQRIGFLGEGGFARVYEVKDPQGTKIACKVVTKASLKTKKAKTKLYAEIKIHRSLDHPNIVLFQDCFEDDENVYMTLELCHQGSLMDMLRRRRRFTEPEARFFMVQLIGACHYMHTHQVIHRDLKLGNLFLDSRMNVKVGDFGLAALIENPGDRKKTICGTPNYIAPEVLFDTANGHSFEVDTWSIGVILYTLAFGRPPFQTKEVKAIYKRIRDNDYDFPTDRVVSNEVKDLISIILTQNPQLRPTLHEIVDHTFFTCGVFPARIPTSSYDSAPDFRHITRQASEANYKKIRFESLLDAETSIALPPKAVAGSTATVHPSLTNANAGNSVSAVAKNVTSSIAQQEKEFLKAVQPGSPISALLSSARQPLMMAGNGGATGRERESPLFRKLQAAQTKQASPLGPGRSVGGAVPRPGRGVPGLHGIKEEDGKEDRWEHEQQVRKKELESQKARIVAQMAPSREDEGEVVEKRERPALASKERDKGKGREIQVDVNLAKEKEVGYERRKERENVAPRDVDGKRAREIAPTRSIVPAPAQPAATELKLNAFEAAARVLTLAFESKTSGKVFRDPREDRHAPIPEEGVFIAAWVDYCDKYGMAYALTDGSVGVYFNDSTTLVLSPDKRHFDYLSSRHEDALYLRKSHTVDSYPEDLKNKVYLLKHFEKYIMERLWGDYPYTFEDLNKKKGMQWVQKYLRMKNVIVFKLSHDVLQFNFYDHTKLILSSHGLAVTYIDKHYKMTRWTLRELMAQSLSPSPELDADQTKFHQRLVDKLKYCKEVLVSIHSASIADAAGEPVGKGLATRTSKTSLR